MNEIIRKTTFKISEMAQCLINRNNTNIVLKSWYSHNKAQVTEKEILSILKQKFPTANDIAVEDVSGGCGAMFNILIETHEFKGLSIVKQHRTVYDTLKEQIKNIHGLHLETKVPK